MNQKISHFPNHTSKIEALCIVAIPRGNLGASLPAKRAAAGTPARPAITQSRRSQRHQARTVAEVAELLASVTGRQPVNHGDGTLIAGPWCITARRAHCRLTAAKLSTWWAEALHTVDVVGLLPCLVYRTRGAQYSAIWPLPVVLTIQSPDMWRDPAMTAQTSIQAWAALAADIQPLTHTKGI